jgi:hypothetical protein
MKQADDMRKQRNGRTDSLLDTALLYSPNNLICVIYMRIFTESAHFRIGQSRDEPR